MAHDLGMGWQSVQDLPAHQREFLLDEIDLLDDVVQTPWVEKEKERRNRAYDRLYTKFKKAADESGQPISADNAEWLVRCHPSMPSPFFGRASRATFTLVKHPPDEIQQHFDGAFGELVQKTFTVLALRSIEWFEKIEARAPTSPRCFDALHDAAMLASSPDRVIFRSVPAEERLRRWQYAVDTKRITRPSRPKGPDRFKNIARDLFFRDIVKDLIACGLSKLKNEATDGVTSACDVVAGVCGVSSSTVRTVFDKGKKRSA